MDFLEGLNPQQREAVAHVNGPLLILAGAGSGKTRVITHRIAHLITAHRVPPYSILAVTFTNKAAQEMRERVQSLVGGDSEMGSSGPALSTFHSFCVRLLRRDGAPLADVRPGFTRQFTIYDDDDQLALIKGVYKEIGIDEKMLLPHRAALSRISHAKNRKETPADFYKNAKDPESMRLATVFERYEDGLRRNNALDFDDLLLETVRLLDHHQPTREAWNRRIHFLMIDEYQDTNRSQYELMRLLSESHKNVCVVGDEDQSIYGWRGADIRNILDFEKDYPNALTIRLEQNYRSTKNILEAASELVSNNTERKGKWLWTESGAGDKISIFRAYDGEAEALYIADTIERLLSRKPDDHVAVLYRTNFQSRPIEEALRRYGRNYIVVGGLSFYQRAEVKDTLAYLKAALSPHDSISLGRIINTPARGIGKTTIELIDKYATGQNLSRWAAIERMLEEKQFSARAQAALADFRKIIEELHAAAQEKPVDELLRTILDRTGYEAMLMADTAPEAESRLENVRELVNAAVEAVERLETPSDFLDHAALVADADALDEKAVVSLLTMHNAKGLEFPIVFIAGMEEGLCPHSRSFETASMIEEERRLCYVGMTRARKRLYLTHARIRRRYGGGDAEACLPSRFLKEIPRQCTDMAGSAKEFREVDLFHETHEVRETVKRNTYTGKTYNSLENISQFFADRGIKPPPRAASPAPPPPASRPVAPPVAAPNKTVGKKGMAIGASIHHPKYGRGTILRKEGDGEDAKLTVSFPGYGLKKLVAKFAGLTKDE